MNLRLHIPVLLMLAALTQPAAAEVINIPAVSFVLRTATGSTDQPGESGNGILQNAKGKFYAPVIIPTTNTYICRFSLLYRDFDSSDLTARLLKKTYVAGGSAFTPPVEMARVQTSGAVDAVRRAVDNSIVQSLVSTTRAFYFVEVEVPDTPLQVLGVELIVLTGGCA